MLLASWVLYGFLLSLVLTGLLFKSSVSLVAGVLMIGLFALLGALDQWLTPSAGDE